MNNTVQATMSSPLPNAQRLTADEILDLPMADLLARTNCLLDSTAINEPKFFGYVTIDGADRTTVYSPDQLVGDLRDASIRYLIAKRFHIAVPVLDALFDCTVYTDADLKAARA